jgi:hypothetical protein
VKTLLQMREENKIGIRPKSQGLRINKIAVVVKSGENQITSSRDERGNENEGDYHVETA